MKCSASCLGQQFAQRATGRGREAWTSCSKKTRIPAISSAHKDPLTVLWVREPGTGEAVSGHRTLRCPSPLQYSPDQRGRTVLCCSLLLCKAPVPHSVSPHTGLFKIIVVYSLLSNLYLRKKWKKTFVTKKSPDFVVRDVSSVPLLSPPNIVCTYNIGQIYLS